MYHVYVHVHVYVFIKLIMYYVPDWNCHVHKLTKLIRRHAFKIPSKPCI